MPRRPETPVRLSLHTHHEIKTLRINEVQDSDTVLCDPNHLVSLTKTEPFLQNIFRKRFRGNAQDILKTLEQNSLYSKVSGRWTKFPTGDYVDDNLYGPLMELCNEIAGLVREGDEHNYQVSARWFDCHSHSPGANDDTQARSRPACVLATETGAANDFDKELEELEEKRETIPPADFKTAENELDRKLHIFWMHIHSMFELRCRNRSDIQTLYQLFTYQRQVLTEQLDRRFVIGFVLCGDELQAVLCDRSGIQVTQTSVNIHERPTLFIEIIGALTQMTPEQLGWDTSMKLYPLSTLEEISSYDVNADFAVENSRYHNHWTIKVAHNEEVEKFVSVSILSAARFDICSRATLVFEVVRYSERFKPSEILVLKRYWRPALESGETDCPQYPTEGRYYEFLQAKDPSGMPKRINSRGDIKVHNDDGELVVDSTFNTIRLGSSVLEASSLPNVTEKIKYRRRDEGDGDSELELYYVTQDKRRVFGFSIDDLAARTPIDRIHTDILIPRGFVIRLFSDLLELLLCLRGCLQDLEICTEEGIVHRDVSTGNLLIMPEDITGRTYGRMIDFDQAKKTYSFDDYPPASEPIGFQIVKDRMKKFLLQKSYSTDEAESLATDVAQVLEKRDVENYIDRLTYSFDVYPPTSEPGFQIVKDVLLQKNDPIIEAESLATDVAQVLWEEDLPRYIKHLNATKEPVGLRPLSDVKSIKWPDFTGYNAKDGKRTGTVPYMSGEVLANFYFLHYMYQTPRQIQARKKFFMHNPAHDVESCLWVLIHICLTRDGPGANAYRDRPLTNSTTQTFIGNTSRNEDLPWRQIVYTYFDAPIDAIGRAKRDLYLQFEGHTIKQITDHFHEYFQPLVPLVEKWWDLIVLAHSFHAREYLRIHSLSILLIEDTIKSLESSPLSEEYIFRNNKEIERRAAEEKRLLQTFRQALQERQAVSSGFTRTASSGSETSSNPTKKFKASTDEGLEMSVD